MVSEGANPPGGDRLYRTSDAGGSFTEVLATTDSIHDVVVLDAQHVMVATQVKGATSIMGGPAYESSDGGMTFPPLTTAPQQLACVAKRADGTLFGCGANWDPDFEAVARSNDGGATWSKTWRFVETQGALKCPEGTVQHDTCDATLWDCPSCMTDLKRQFGAKGSTCLPHDVDVTPPIKKGCCDGSGAESSLLWLFVLGWWLSRKR